MIENTSNMTKLKEILCNLDYHWYKRLSKYKGFEIEASSGLIGLLNKIFILLGSREINFDLSIFYSLFHFEFRASWMTDHAGVSLWLGLLGFDVGLHFYDTRHWDYDNDRWEVCEEDGK